jgi:NADPH:quinone reductase-like Zn-dependent oxidoreductase
MKAIYRDRFGSPEVLELRDMEKPAIKDDEVLVRVRAASVNPADWATMRGVPYIGRPVFGFRKPKMRVLGYDLAGTVEAVGSGVTGFRCPSSCRRSWAPSCRYRTRRTCSP